MLCVRAGVFPGIPPQLEVFPGYFLCCFCHSTWLFFWLPVPPLLALLESVCAVVHWLQNLHLGCFGITPKTKENPWPWIFQTWFWAQCELLTPNPSHFSFPQDPVEGCHPKECRHKLEKKQGWCFSKIRHLLYVYRGELWACIFASGSQRTLATNKKKN